MTGPLIPERKQGIREHIQKARRLAAGMGIDPTHTINLSDLYESHEALIEGMLRLKCYMCLIPLRNIRASGCWHCESARAALRNAGVQS